jgi:hypothetical protein
MDLDEIERQLEELDAHYRELRELIVGEPPKEENGLRSRIWALEDALQEFRQTFKIVKWGVLALIAMKSPDLVAWIKPLLH